MEHSTPESTAVSANQSIVLPIIKRRPMPRKGHTKSRAGCIVCKKRKVKCDEANPKCGPCQRLNLDCEYRQNKHRSQTPNALSRPLRSTPAMFDIDDLNFFRHFLFQAYPPLPIDGFSAWQDASRLSHEYEFLLHAMLGLGASHLSILSPSGYEKAALKHRVTAIKSLNEHLSKPNTSKADADAAFGALLVLTFQSAYMADGLVDFLTMIRGCFLVGTHTVPNIDNSIFKAFGRAVYVARVRELVHYNSADHHLDAIIAEGFCRSTRQIGPLCKSVPEMRYLAHMQKIAVLAATDPAESFYELSFFYDGLGDISPEDFACFVNPENPVSQLVILHMLVLDYVMSRKTTVKNPLTPGEMPRMDKGNDCRNGMSRLWIEQILERLPQDYRSYAEWPVEFIRGLTYSFEKEDEVWVPFFLSNGQATLEPGQNTTISEDIPPLSPSVFLDQPIILQVNFLDNQ